MQPGDPKRHAMSGLLFGVVLGSACAGEVQFSEVSAARGIGAYTNAAGMNAGAAVADFDNDGDLDIFVPNGRGVADQLYRNLGNGYFEEVASTFGLASLENNRAGLWVDYDADGDLDLLVAGDDFQQAVNFLTSNLRLHRRNENGTFTDVTVAAGLFGALNDPISNPDNHLGGLAAGDFDNDGMLDLLVTYWQGYSYLYRNSGNGSFSASSAIARPFETYWQPVFADFDRDGLADLFIAVDFHQNLFFHNQGNGNLVELAGTMGMQNDEQNDMGVAVGDIDNDGDLDIFVSNIYSGKNRRNHLYRNESSPGAPQFSEIAIPAGVADAGWGWGASFADVDLDGHLDLGVTNGFFGEDDPTRLFRNLGSGTPGFTDIAATSGFNDTEWGGCLLSFDADGDGDPDFLQTTVDGPLRLLLNQPGAGSGFLVVRPRMESGNRFAIGAVVRVGVGATTMTRLIAAGTSLLCQEPAEAMFGLGSSTLVDRVTVEWPGGKLTVLNDVAINQILQVSDTGIFATGFDAAGSSPVKVSAK